MKGSGDEWGQTIEKYLTPNHLCNLLEFNNKNAIFSQRLDFLSQE